VGGFILKLIVLSALLLGLPLLGVALAGRPVAPYLHFPPRTRFVEHAGFDWQVFGFTLLASAFAMVVVARLLRAGFGTRELRTEPAPFPSWGRAAVALLAVAWLLSWTRFDWFAPWQAFTFPFLWLGYTLTINAWTVRLRGGSLMTERPRYFAALFPASALFWWYFEYLNRFVQNWHYVGTEGFGPVAYVVHATLAFSTVLPAVMSTADWLQTLLRPGPSGPRWDLAAPLRRPVAAVVLVVFCAALLALGVWPDYLYPLLWIAPLAILLSLQVLLREPTLLGCLEIGDWRALYMPALAALQCGLLWEMWNYWSAAKWVYTIPFVHRFEIFEMPLLGYAGYLPFGIECAAVAYMLTTVKRLEGPIFGPQRRAES